MTGVTPARPVRLPLLLPFSISGLSGRAVQIRFGGHFKMKMPVALCRSLFVAALFAMPIFAHAAPVAVGQSLTPLPPDDHIEQALELEPMVGVSMFTAVGAKNDVKYTRGFVGGVLADFAISIANLKIETGLAVIQEGDSRPEDNFQRTNNYLGIPALVKYNPFTTQLQPFVRAGLMPTFLYSAHRSSQSSSGDSTGDSMPVDIQALLGVGLSYPVGKTTSVALDVNFMRGLVSFLREASPIYNQGFTVTLGVLF